MTADEYLDWVEETESYLLDCKKSYDHMYREYQLYGYRKPPDHDYWDSYIKRLNSWKVYIEREESAIATNKQYGKDAYGIIEYRKSVLHIPLPAPPYPELPEWPPPTNTIAYGR